MDVEATDTGAAVPPENGLADQASPDDAQPDIDQPDEAISS
jgi:hypothetical protein